MVDVVGKTNRSFGAPSKFREPESEDLLTFTQQSNTEKKKVLFSEPKSTYFFLSTSSYRSGVGVAKLQKIGFWNCDRSREMESQYISKHHRHIIGANQCSYALTKHIKAPVDIVWSLVRRFDQPQKYKPFVSECTMNGELKIGSLREVNVRSGLPATTSTEMLELLDDEEHIFGIRIVDGDHRLRNYSSVVTVHPEMIDGIQGTLVMESFVVDVPQGNTKEETVYFVKALINCNLKSLADVSERMAANSQSV